MKIKKLLLVGLSGVTLIAGGCNVQTKEKTESCTITISNSSHINIVTSCDANIINSKEINVYDSVESMEKMIEKMDQDKQ